MWLGPSNQLIQIDTGKARTYLYNKALSPISVYSDIGEAQVLGQRYVGQSNVTAANPTGSPTIYMLVKYLATSALVTANLQAGPAPVYWTDETFSTISGISSESGFGLNGIAGYLMVNTTDLPNLTAAQVLGAQLLIAVGGLVQAAFGPASGTAGVGNLVEPVAGTFASQGVAAGTAPGYIPLGVQLTALASGLCDVWINGPDAF